MHLCCVSGVAFHSGTFKKKKIPQATTGDCNVLRSLCVLKLSDIDWLVKTGSYMIWNLELETCVSIKKKKKVKGLKGDF